MDDVTPDTPAADRPVAPASPPPAPRPPASVPPRRSASSVLPLIALLAVGALWLRTDGQIARLRDDHRRLSQDVGALKQTQMIDVAGAPALGPDNVPVTLVEFSDYECPFCVRHFKQTMPQIEANFIKPGRIRYVFRDFPIDELHPEAIRAHETARCGLEQDLDKYWQLHRSLFSAPGTHTKDALEARAREAGLDTAAIQACLASGRVTAGIRRSGEVASSLGANGTPAFFVGLRERGSDRVRVLEAIKGAHPYSVFEQAIQRALDQAR
ncbi:MAG TPA: thioredoxin domain-containing protein [Vicinamibacterales bacterium]|nr:thioredoxin domain-containing protein [Vicinamibacterales bacterium]